MQRRDRRLTSEPAFAGEALGPTRCFGGFYPDLLFRWVGGTFSPKAGPTYRRLALFSRLREGKVFAGDLEEIDHHEELKAE
jgi:hypothetical protein